MKLGDKSHIPVMVVSLGEFLNTANSVLSTFCTIDKETEAAILADKSRYNFHDFSKDLYAHQSYKNEISKNKSSFMTPKKGHFYRIEMDVQ